MSPDRVPVLAVHGFMYDPADVGGSNDPAGFFQEMSGIVGQPVIPFAWYSVPFGLRAARPFHSIYQTARAWLGAWTHGATDPYKLAWRRAQQEGDRLHHELILMTGGPVDIVAHSLGVRVVLNALDGLPAGKVRRVVFFNGAELTENAQDIVAGLCPGLDRGTEVLNLAITCDQVLRWLGSTFNGQAMAPCIGRTGLGPRAPFNWHDLFLDSAAVAAKARKLYGWTLRADSPDDLLDHGESYRFAGNTDLVREFLAGDNLAELTEIRA